ncbi:MAG: hypothetical protein K0R50_610 [Eubacterium sp.]|jgi:hypothetical protein|nr:hypothetical protein [Eubacterium sp.]
MSSKFQNFWYYYKFHVIVIFFIALSIVIAVLLTGKRTDPDIQIGYVTDGREISEEAKANINKYFENVITDVNEDNEKLLSFIPLIGPRVDLEFASDGAQIILMDSNTLVKYKDMGALEPLDAFVKKHGMDVSGNTEVMSRAEGDNVEHIFALPMRNIKFLLDAGFPAEDYYLTVRVEYDKNKESNIKNKNAYAIMDQMLDYKE